MLGAFLKRFRVGKPGHFSFMYSGYHHSSMAVMPVSPRFSTFPVAVASSIASLPVVAQISMATSKSPVLRPANCAR